MSAADAIDIRHLSHLMGAHGLYEHALGSEPRPEHGYCTDDNARLLVVAVRGEGDELAELSRRALAFVKSAQAPDGRIRNRMDDSGAWTDEPTTDDCWGRAVWGLGVATACSHDTILRLDAGRAFTLSASLSAQSPRSMAFAALGAAEVLAVEPSNVVARRLLMRTVTAIGPIPSGEWCWPEKRLAYANAALAEALIAAGSALNSAADVNRGLKMLGWLLARETQRGHLSTTPVGGSGPDDRGPRFDQQPIEAAALADACARAHEVTGDPMWVAGIEAAAGWFGGRNDAGTSMIDPATGGGYDGLRADGPNLNQGAESTLALISTLQRARGLALTSDV